MKATSIVLLSILCLTLAAWSADGAVTGPPPPAAKGKLGFGFEPGLVAGKDFVEGQLIVGVQDGMSTQAVRAAAVAERGRVAKEIAGQALLVDFDSEAAALAAVPQLLATPGVLYVERNGFMRIPPQPQLPADLKRQKGSGATSERMTVATLSSYPSTPGWGAFRYWIVGDLTKDGNVYTWTNADTCSNTGP
jgi:hypothetical protein